MWYLLALSAWHDATAEAETHATPERYAWAMR
jgi:hypothetical protein